MPMCFNRMTVDMVPPNINNPQTQFEFTPLVVNDLFWGPKSTNPGFKRTAQQRLWDYVWEQAEEHEKVGRMINHGKNHVRIAVCSLAHKRGPPQ